MTKVNIEALRNSSEKNTRKKFYCLTMLLAILGLILSGCALIDNNNVATGGMATAMPESNEQETKEQNTNGQEQNNEAEIQDSESTKIYEINEFIAASSYSSDIGGNAYETKPQISSWELALEDFLSDFLPIFTPDTIVQTEWSKHKVGGWMQFVREYIYESQDCLERTDFYIVDPVTEERIDYSYTPYIFVLDGTFYDGTEWELIYIADSFYLKDIDNDGIPELLISWSAINGMPFGFVSMYKYNNSGYTMMSVSRGHLQSFQEDSINSPALLHWGASMINEMLAKDSYGRTLVLGMGGAGGVESSAYILSINNDSIWLEPVFWMRYGWEADRGSGQEFQLLVNESIVDERTTLLDVDENNVSFFPWEWLYGEGDLVPVPVPFMPHVTAEPIQSMTELEQEITIGITARLLAEGRILE